MRTRPLLTLFYQRQAGNSPSPSPLPLVLLVHIHTRQSRSFPLEPSSRFYRNSLPRPTKVCTILHIHRHTHTFFFLFFLAAPTAYGSSQARGSNLSCSSDLGHSCSNARSQPATPKRELHTLLDVVSKKKNGRTLLTLLMGTKVANIGK